MSSSVSEVSETNIIGISDEYHTQQFSLSLGLLYLSIGGSRAYDRTKIGESFSQYGRHADWDWFGITKTKANSVSLVMQKRSQLCALLSIEIEECPSWEFLTEHDSHDQWEVLRFSGWGRDSSKRTIKLWNKSHLRRIGVNPNICTFGVLSARNVRFVRRFHPSDGHRIFIYQTVRLPGGMFILRDADILIPEDRSIANASGNLGVSCDLFLTSRRIYERELGFLDVLKGTILKKWLKFSAYPYVKAVFPSLYGYENFTTLFAAELESELVRLASDSGLNQASDNVWLSGNDWQRPSFRRSYFLTHFSPIQQIHWSEKLDTPESEIMTHPCGTVLGLRTDENEKILHKFSSNSKCSFAELKGAASKQWVQAVIKSGIGTLRELSIFPVLRLYFSPDRLQKILTVQDQGQKIVYSRFLGQTLNNVRLKYCLGENIPGYEDPLRLTETLLDIEMSRAEDVLSTYWSSAEVNNNQDEHGNEAINRFYYDRLASDHRLLELYETSDPKFLSMKSGQSMNLRDFCRLPIIINGRSYPSLRRFLDDAEDTLSPHSEGGLSLLPVTLGFGDGHGGNVMVNLERNTPSMLYIDYEVAGFHSPFLDQAKPIYNDGFFNIMYADLLCEDVTAKDNISGAEISWELDRDAVRIDCSVKLDPLAKMLATAKLEYVLRPVAQRLKEQAPHQVQFSQDVLARSLFTCAILTRDFSARADVFYLNLAMGVLLASDMKEVLSNVFGWNNLPTTKFLPIDSMTSVSEEQLHSVDFSTSSESHVEKLNAVRHTEDSHDFNQSKLKIYNMLIRDLLMSSLKLEPDNVFLKRSSDTFLLHKFFSNVRSESSGAIIQRINNTRKLGMKIAPHTCIRESLFAEPRIDLHFAYSKIINIGMSRRSTLIDVGCCMGTDIRKIVQDGYPAENVMGLDLEEGFIDLGHVLYNDSLCDSIIRFRQGNMLDHDFPNKHPDLVNSFDSVHSSNVIHLFNEEDQERFFQNLAQLVKPGGIIWGRQVGLADDEHKAVYRQPAGKGKRFTAREFWRLCSRATGWDAKDAHYEARIVEYDELRAHRLDKRWVLQWLVRAPLEDTQGRHISE